MRRALAVAVAALVATAGAPARAQELLIGASAQAASGMQGGGRGDASGIFRARTRLRIGADLRVDESPKDIWMIALVADVEPRSAFGADVRYARALGTHFVVDAGLLSYFAPSTLFGAVAGLDYRLPISTSTAFTIGPDAAFFALGSDLPDGNVLWQVLLQAGIRADL